MTANADITLTVTEQENFSDAGYADDEEAEAAYTSFAKRFNCTCNIAFLNRSGDAVVTTTGRIEDVLAHFNYLGVPLNGTATISYTVNG